MLFTGIISFLKLGQEIKNFIENLIIRIERDISLVINLILTQKR